MIKFISYDGEYPCLCGGTLKVEVNGKLYSLDHCLISGGNVEFTDDWDEAINQGMWSLDLRKYPELEQHKDEIIALVNENVPYGCCGGCV